MTYGRRDTGSQVGHRMAPTRFGRCNLFRLPLDRQVAHDGVGVIGAVRVATRAELAGDCNYIDYAELPPGTSIGDHRHGPGEEEFYLVLSGRGVMRLDSDVFDVAAGDLVRNPPGGLHGLTNAGDQPLCLFVFELARRPEQGTCAA